MLRIQLPLSLREHAFSCARGDCNNVHRSLTVLSAAGPPRSTIQEHTRAFGEWRRAEPKAAEEAEGGHSKVQARRRRSLQAEHIMFDARVWRFHKLRRIQKSHGARHWYAQQVEKVMRGHQWLTACAFSGFESASND